MFQQNSLVKCLARCFSIGNRSLQCNHPLSGSTRKVLFILSRVITCTRLSQTQFPRAPLQKLPPHFADGLNSDEMQHKPALSLPNGGNRRLSFSTTTFCADVNGLRIKLSAPSSGAATRVLSDQTEQQKIASINPAQVQITGPGTAPWFQLGVGLYQQLGPVIHSYQRRRLRQGVLLLPLNKSVADRNSI